MIGSIFIHLAKSLTDSSLRLPPSGNIKPELDFVFEVDGATGHGNRANLVITLTARDSVQRKVPRKRVQTLGREVELRRARVRWRAKLSPQSSSQEA